MLLELRNMAVAYGTAPALNDVSLSVDAAESVTLTGANGAGKTSCLRAISEITPLAGGEIHFLGERIDTASPRRRDLEAMFTRFPILSARRKQQAGSLSGGEQQILAFARGLMARPKLLLVDEPSVGLSPIMVQELSRTLRQIHREGVAILLVEQNAAMALRLASRGYMLETGRVVAEGATAMLRGNDYVRKAYLGL